MSLQVNITEGNIGTVINNLTMIVVAANESVDQNSDSIRVVRLIFFKAAALLQSSTSVPLEEAEQVSWDMHSGTGNVVE